MGDNIKVIRLVPSGNSSQAPFNDEKPSQIEPPKKQESKKGSFEFGFSYKTLIFCGLFVVLCLILSLSYRWFIYSESHISTNNSYIETDIWQVNSRNLGYVKSVLIYENETVKKGQVLALLDDSDVQIEIKYKQTKYNKTLADVLRARSLSHSRLVSKSDLETAEATLTGIQADLDGSLLKLEFTKILAPADGIIGKLSIHPGQFVQPGQTLMLLVLGDPFWVKANYKETDLRKVKRGMSVEVEIDAFPGERWEGLVESIYPTSGANMSLIPPENATGNFTKIVQRIPVKIRLQPKPGFELRSGMSAVSTIIVR